jgi:S1 RNA binding domain protein
MEETKQTMELTVGSVLEGKVKSITNFGAFIALPENKTGMVHISEVANAYVSDIRQHLTEGQDVKVLVIGNENGKINLSIKRLEPKPQRDAARRDFRPGNNPRPVAGRSNQGQGHQGYRSGPVPNAAPKTADQLFEEKLKAFMSESDSKISSIKQYSEHRTKSRRR